MGQIQIEKLCFNKKLYLISRWSFFRHRGTTYASCWVIAKSCCFVYRWNFTVVTREVFYERADIGRPVSHILLARQDRLIHKWWCFFVSCVYFFSWRRCELRRQLEQQSRWASCISIRFVGCTCALRCIYGLFSRFIRSFRWLTRPRASTGIHNPFTLHTDISRPKFPYVTLVCLRYGTRGLFYGRARRNRAVARTTPGRLKYLRFI